MRKPREDNGKPKAGTPSERFEDISLRRWSLSRECSAECKSAHWKAKNSESVQSHIGSFIRVTSGRRHHFQAFERKKSILSEASKLEC
jgi:hypothetical protein